MFSSSNGPTIKEEPRSESPSFPTSSTPSMNGPETNGTSFNNNVPSPQMQSMDQQSLTDSPQRMIDRNDLPLPTATAAAVQV